MRYFSDTINAFHSNQFHYILEHGETFAKQKQIEKILRNHGDQDEYNIILHGHHHTLSAREAKDATLVGVPALANRGEYAKKIDAHSTP